MKDDLTGPALGGTEERWAEWPRQDLYAWIRNSQGLISQGHPRAVDVWEEWKPTVMSQFPGLTDLEIESILLYINNVYTGVGEEVAGGDQVVSIEEETDSDVWLYLGILLILIVLSLVLARVITNLRYMSAVAEGREAHRRSLVEVLTSPGVIAFVVFALVILGGYTTVNNAIDLGRQQGYQPEQPIKFSHALHAGTHQIECLYCHDGARRSKHSVIPAASTCMNCHRAIKKGPLFGTQEITKIYASIGYNPINDTYIENYDAMPNEEIQALYTEWIRSEYERENEGVFDRKGEETVASQWQEIYESLTTLEQDNKIAGPIKWLRIHNLPDHAYFNHAQHVSVGKIACQTCHGPVQEMEVVYQYSPLSMGWCINCHRQTPVQFEENRYYDTYEQYHEEIQAGTRVEVTVEEIGGIECQKCHY